MRPCAIAGCLEDGVNVLGVRCRLPNTRATWAPNAGAGLCHEHARRGVTVRLSVELVDWADFVTVVCAGTYRVVPLSEAVAQ